MSPISLERALLLYSQNVSEKPFDIKQIPAEEQVVETKKDSQGPSSLPLNNKPTEKLASRQDVYSGKLLILALKRSSVSAQRCGVSRTTGRHSRVLAPGPLVQIVDSDRFDRGRDRVRGQVHQAHVQQLHRFPSKCQLCSWYLSRGALLAVVTAQNQFDCTNTLNDQLLEKVTIKMETSDGYEVISYKPCPKLAYNHPGVAYALVKIPEDPTQGELCAAMRHAAEDQTAHFPLFIRQSRQRSAA